MENSEIAKLEIDQFQTKVKLLLETKSLHFENMWVMQ